MSYRVLTYINVTDLTPPSVCPCVRVSGLCCLLTSSVSASGSLHHASLINPRYISAECSMVNNHQSSLPPSPPGRSVCRYSEPCVTLVTPPQALSEH
ncbi:unnamed protein product [Danaus chrysippus]|uniref:(African queen) hypothetical protein n=1 Tax=Danaus chrysippus TaxID=151541 RepID=A0A8J2VS38_9NEOP|nr:unnamed protein product [Danaus chrysippus]